MKTVLWLGANPPTTERLDLEKEVAKVERELEAARYRDQIEFKHKPAVQAFDIVHAVSDIKPEVVHFSGHGSREGIILRHDDGTETVASTSWLRDLFAERGVQLVVLNCCSSQSQAEAIAEVVPCVIGTSQDASDEAAVRFSRMFYRRLVDGESVKQAARDARLMANFDGGDVYIEFGGERLEDVLFSNTGTPADQGGGRTTGGDRSVTVNGDANQPIVTGDGNSVSQTTGGIHIQNAGNVNLSAKNIVGGNQHVSTGRRGTGPNLEAINMWREKIAFLETELAKTADAAQRFSIQQQINEAKSNLDGLGG